jgi:membrane protease YdiL (CAAX protease family)
MPFPSIVVNNPYPPSSVTTRDKNDTPSPDVVLLPPWGLGTVVLCLGFGYVGAPLLGQLFFQWAYPTLASDLLYLGIQLSIAVGWGFIFWVLSKVYRQGLAPFGLWDYLGLHRRQPLLSHFWPVLCGLIGLLGILLVLSVVADHTAIHHTNPYQQLSLGRKHILVVFAVVMAPAIEELVFRGMLQSTLYKVFGFRPWGRVLTIVSGALVFTACHFDYHNALYAQLFVTLLALVLGVLRDRFGSIFPGMIAHLANNALAAAALLMG